MLGQKFFLLLSAAIAVNLTVVAQTATASPPSCTRIVNGPGIDPVRACCGGPGTCGTIESKIALGGGCSHGSANTINASFPKHVVDAFSNKIPTGWECGYGDNDTTAYALCCILPAGMTCHVVPNSTTGSSVNALCNTANGEMALGGGCFAPGGTDLQASHPLNSSVTYPTLNLNGTTTSKHTAKGWGCSFYSSDSITAYAICCKP